jgi:signal transduction histidine kinase
MAHAAHGRPLLLVCLIAASCAVALAGDGYRTPLPEGLAFHAPAVNLPESRLLADIDGDGADELVFWSGNAILATEPRTGDPAVAWQANLPPRYTLVGEQTRPVPGAGPFPMVRLASAGDRDGDGCEDVVLTAVDTAGTGWVVGLVDGRTGGLSRLIPLPTGPDTRADGIWEGDWNAIGLLPAGEAAPGEAVVLVCNPGYDWEGRLVAVRELETGREIWSHPFGPNPTPRDCWVGDLEADGSTEIVIGTSSPGNLGDRRIGGHGDDRSILRVYDARGALRWERVFGTVFGRLELAVLDLDGDGRAEIVTATRHSRADDRDSLEILDADGNVVARRWLPAAPRGVFAATAGGSARIYLADADGVLSCYTLRDGELSASTEHVYGRRIHLNDVADVLPSPGPELVVHDAERQTMVVHAADLQVLHRTPPATQNVSDARLWRADDGRAGVVRFGQPTRFWPLGPAPASPLPWLMAAAVAAVAALVAAGLLARRRRARSGSLAAAPEGVGTLAAEPALVIRRDVMRSIFGEVLVTNHGRISLVETLKALGAQLGRCGTSLVRIADADVRARRAIEDFLEFDRDALEEILVKAAAVRFEPERTAALGAGLERITATLEDLLASDLAPEVVDRLRPELEREVGTLERDFLAFYDELERHFTCDLPAILARVLDRYTDLASRQRVTIVTESDRAHREPCLVEAAALRLTLDNLVGNALRAMSDSRDRVLRITWEGDRSTLVVRVADTGCGITADHADDLFSGRASRRPGGGVGLARSRRLLAHTGGVIELESSAPGRGSVFRLRLPRPVFAVGGSRQEGASA